MRPSIRQILGDSHIAAVAIAVLLLRSFEFGVRSLAQPVVSLTGFLIDVVAIREIPYGTFTSGQWFTLLPAFANFGGGVISLFAAWLLSRWVYGMGPFHSLTECSTKIARGNDA